MTSDGDYDGSITVAGIDSTTQVMVVLINEGVGSSSSTTAPAVGAENEPY